MRYKLDCILILLGLLVCVSIEYFVLWGSVSKELVGKVDRISVYICDNPDWDSPHCSLEVRESYDILPFSRQRLHISAFCGPYAAVNVYEQNDSLFIDNKDYNNSYYLDCNKKRVAINQDLLIFIKKYSVLL